MIDDDKNILYLDNSDKLNFRDDNGVGTIVASNLELENVNELEKNEYNTQVEPIFDSFKFNNNFTLNNNSYMEINNNIVSKTSGNSDGWTRNNNIGVVYSSESYTGFVHLKAKLLKITNLFIGLSKQLTHNTIADNALQYETLDFSWHINNSLLYVYEKDGVKFTENFSYSVNDIIEIIYEYDGTVKYYQNGTFRYKSLVSLTSNETFYLNSSFLNVINNSIEILEFSSNHYIEIPSHKAPQLAGSDFTIEFWAKINSITGNDTILKQGNYADHEQIEIYIDSSNIYLNFFNGRADFNHTSLNINNWNHFAIVFDNSGESNNGSAVCYFNGIQQNTTYWNDLNTHLPGMKGQTNASGNIILGDYPEFSSPYYFNGELKHLRVYNSIKYNSNFTVDTINHTVIDNIYLTEKILSEGKSNLDINLLFYAPMNNTSYYYYNDIIYNLDLTTSNEYFTFNGISDYIKIPSHKAPQLAGSNFTIEFWAKLTDVGSIYFQSQNDIHNNYGANTYMNILTTSNFFRIDFNSATMDVNTDMTVYYNIWTHFAITYDNSSSNNSDAGSIYINGNKQSTTNYGSGSAQFHKGTTAYGEVSIGKRYDSSPYYFNGELKQLRVYNSVKYTSNFNVDLDNNITLESLNEYNLNDLNNYFKFNGISDYIEIPANQAPQLSNSDFTIEFWANINSNTTSTNSVIYSQTNTDVLNNYLTIGYNSDEERIELNLQNYNIGWNISSYFDKWNHYAITYNDNNNNNNSQLYINGESESNLVLYLKSNTTHGSTTFIDETNRHILQGYNGIMHSTDISKFGSSSIKGKYDADDDENGAYISPQSNDTNHDDFNFGSSDFTIELWVYPTNDFGSPISRADSSGYNRSQFLITRWTKGWWILLGEQDGSDGWSYNSNSYSNSNFQTNNFEWQHIALCRYKDKLKFFINGKMVLNATLTNGESYKFSDADQTTQPLRIGTYNYNSVPGIGTRTWDGYLDEIKIFKGHALYINDFNPNFYTSKFSTNTSILRIGSSYNNTYVNVNTSFINNKVSKISGTNGVWDSNIYSNFSYKYYCNLQLKMLSNNKIYQIGLNQDPTTNAHMNSIDYSFQVDSTTLYIYENGTQKQNLGSFNFSDLLEIEYNNTSIKYIRNNITVRTVTVSSGLSFYLDSSIYHIGDNLFEIIQFNGNNNSYFNGELKHLRVYNNIKYNSNFTVDSTNHTITSNQYSTTLDSNFLLYIPMNNHNLYNYDGSNTIINVVSNSLFSFNGTSDYIEIPANDAPQLANSDFTIEFWAKIDFDGFSENDGLIFWQGDNYDDANSSIQVKAKKTNKYLYLDFGQTWELKVNATSYDNILTHYTITWDNTNSIIKFYVNGDLKESHSTSTNSSGTSTLSNGTTASGSINIGKGINDSYFKGELKHLRVYNTIKYSSNFSVDSTNHIITNNPYSTTLDSDLLLYIFIDDYSYDRSNDNNTITNTITPITQFNGTSDYIEIPANKAPQLANSDFTIEFWAKLEPQSQIASIFLQGKTRSYETGQRNIFEINLNQSTTSSNPTEQIWYNTLQMLIYDNTHISGTGTGRRYHRMKVTSYYGIWTHYALTFNSSDNSFKWYINGNVQDTTDPDHNSGSSSVVLTSSDSIYIGKRVYEDNNVDTFFSGELKQLRVYNSVKYTSNFNLNIDSTNHTITSNPYSTILDSDLLLYFPIIDSNFYNYNKTIYLISNPLLSFNVIKSDDEFIFNGISDYIEIPANEAPQLANSDFTIEFYAKLSKLATNSDVATIYSQGTNSVNNRLNIAYDGGTADNLYLNFHHNWIRWNISSYLNKWTHYAIVYSNNNARLYVNGILLNVDNTYSSTTITTNASGLIEIGKNSEDGNYLLGELKHLRVYNSIKYNSDFSVDLTNYTITDYPYSLTLDKTLLYIPMNNNNYFTSLRSLLYIPMDNSSSLYNYNGNNTVIDYFNNISYNIDLLSDQHYTFNGNDYIEIPANQAPQLANSNFTIEFWVKITSGSYPAIFSQGNRTSAGHDIIEIYFHIPNKILYMNFSEGRAEFDVSTLINDSTIYNWNHFAIVYDSSGFSNMGSALCYINGNNSIITDYWNDSNTHLDGMKGQTNASGKIILGDNLESTNKFHGELKHLRVYNSIKYTSNFSVNALYHTVNENDYLTKYELTENVMYKSNFTLLHETNDTTSTNNIIQKMNDTNSWIPSSGSRAIYSKESYTGSAYLRVKILHKPIEIFIGFSKSKDFDISSTGFYYETMDYTFHTNHEQRVLLRRLRFLHESP